MSLPVLIFIVTGDDEINFETILFKRNGGCTIRPHFFGTEERKQPIFAEMTTEILPTRINMISNYYVLLNYVICLWL